MVTRSARCLSASRTPRLLRLAKALALACALAGAAAGGAAAQGAATVGDTVVLLTAKSATMAPTRTDQAFKELEAEHGPLQNDRAVNWSGMELTFLADDGRTLSLGLGLEVFDYVRDFRFEDPTGTLPPERLRLTGRALLYTLQAHLRWGWLQPFAGVGSGNFYVKYQERDAGVSYQDSAPQVWAGRLGLRLRLGPLALLYEAGQVDAAVDVRTRRDTPMLELGGRYEALGLTVIF